MLICDVVMFRWGVRRWCGEVNDMLKAGWTLKAWTIEHRWLGLRILCEAILEPPVKK